jgi:hypothetical protein
MKRTIITLTALALLVTACGGGDSGTAGGGTTEPLPAPEEPRVILEVRDDGGFVPVEWNLRRVPRYVLMSDGTLYGPGAVPAIYPGPALPAVVTAKLDQATLDDVLAQIEALGLADITGERNDEAMVMVADLPDTVVTYFDEAGAHSFSVYALGFQEFDWSDRRIPALAELVASLDRAFVDSQPADLVEFHRTLVYAGTREIPVEPDFQDIRPWSFPVQPSEMTEGNAGFRCVLLEGEEADAVLGSLADASETTTFEIDGAEYTVVVRPLFDHEAVSC